MERTNIKTFGELKVNNYFTKSIKDELRDNLIKSFKSGENVFEGILGYEDTVIPDLETAILSKHNIILLGLRGQAKTKIARLLTNLLDEHIPAIAGSEVHDDPYQPISVFGKKTLAEMGDDTPIEWIHKSERYSEKLATPDVTIADLVGDIDPIKAANMKLHYSDERVIHFGIIPRSNRSIFVINELPDLQARIQVALFNMLQEKDVQIRGFKLRLPLDMQFVFTANPEDYTNRGSIVTPLKDRIESQILTHYPKSIDVSREITSQEARISDFQKESIIVPEVVTNLVEQIAFEARHNEYIDDKSGVSARLTISAYENLLSSIERRMLKNDEPKGMARISDFKYIIPSITGKVELVYEGEQEGPYKVAQILIGKAIKNLFPKYFPNPDKISKDKDHNPYKAVLNWFNDGNSINLLNDVPESVYSEILHSVNGLSTIIEEFYPNIERNEKLMMMEFVLFGLSENSLLSKHILERGFEFSDMLSNLFSSPEEEDDDYQSYY